MSIYLRPREKWSLKVAHQYSRRLSAKLGAPITSRSESSVSLRCTYRYGGLALQSACINFDEVSGQTVEIYWSSTRTRSASVPVVSRSRHSSWTTRAR